MEQMLKGVDFRTFAFTYIFVPKSQEEARCSIKSYGFRSAMLPDTYAPLGGVIQNNFFNYPNTFEIASTRLQIR